MLRGPLTVKRWLALLLLLPLGLTSPIKAFDGGGLDNEKAIEISDDKSEIILPEYSVYHASCMDIQLRMWGEVAELMEDLATAHCYCEYSKLEQLDELTFAQQQDVEASCAREGTINKKEAFIWWALPLHWQRLKGEN